MRYPTLTACAEALLDTFFRQCEEVDELKAREEATLVAIDRLYDRRLREIRTAQEMKLKTAMAAETDHDGKKN